MEPRGWWAGSKTRSYFTFHDALESSDENLYFQSYCRMTVLHPKRHTTTFESAARCVRVKAERAVVKFGLLRLAAAEQELAHVLRECLPLRVGALKILEVNYSLRIEDEDREAARRRHALSNRKFLESLERERVGAELAFIRQVVLQDPASAEIYKFLQLSKGGAEAAYGEIYDRLAVLCSEWSPDGQWVLLARVLHEFLTELPPAAKEDLLVIIQACMEASGRLDLVDKVRAVVDRVDS